MQTSAFRPSLISLSIGKQKSVQTNKLGNVFGDDDEDEIPKPQTSAEKFHSKYGNLKAKDERVVKKILEETPDIYDYDAAYDNIQKKRIKVEEEEEMSRQVNKKVSQISIRFKCFHLASLHRQFHEC